MSNVKLWAFSFHRCGQRGQREGWKRTSVRIIERGTSKSPFSLVLSFEEEMFGLSVILDYIDTPWRNQLYYQEEPAFYDKVKSVFHTEVFLSQMSSHLRVHDHSSHSCPRDVSCERWRCNQTISTFLPHIWKIIWVSPLSQFAFSLEFIMWFLIFLSFFKQFTMTSRNGVMTIQRILLWGSHSHVPEIPPQFWRTARSSLTISC